MSDYCVFCDTRRPQGGTNHLVLNEGKVWLEFCTTCGDREWLENQLTGERITVYNLFAQGDESRPYREPTQSFEEWQDVISEADAADYYTGPEPAQSQASPAPSQPTLADVWPR